MPSEKSILSKLVETLRVYLPSFVIVKRADPYTIGLPDLEVTGNRYTSFYEAKIADPDFKSTGIQELTMKRLAKESHHARYIIWDMRDKKAKRTFIVHPQNFVEWDTKFEHVFEGFDHLAFVSYIRKVHRLEE